MEKSDSFALTMTRDIRYFMFEEDLEQRTQQNRLNEPGIKKLEGQIFWQLFVRLLVYVLHRIVSAEVLAENKTPRGVCVCVCVWGGGDGCLLYTSDAADRR